MNATTRSLHSQRWHRLAIARAVLAYGILPNLPFWIGLSFVPHTTIGLLNLDFLVVALLSLYIKRAWSTIILVLVFFVEMLEVLPSLYFLSEHDALLSLKYIILLSWYRTLMDALLLLSVAVAIALLTEYAAGKTWLRYRRTSTCSIVFLVALLAGIRLLSSDTSIWHRDAYAGAKFATSSGSHLIKELVAHSSQSYDSTSTQEHVPSATETYLQKTDPATAKHGAAHNLVLIVVESYGDISNPAYANWLLSPYFQPGVTRRYDVQLSHSPFKGATVSGEFRELCGLQLDIPAITSVSFFAQDCVPAAMNRKGYMSTGLHGFSGQMFDRAHWWKAIGFSQTLFFEDLRNRPGIKMCSGPVPGICDADMANVIRGLLLAAPRTTPQFVYWVSLNSHLPIAISTGSSAVFQCNQKTAVVQDSAICNWMGLIFTVNNAVANLASDPNLPPTDFIIVGDHAPPFYSKPRRAEFSPTEVPVIYLRSKQ